jgi:GTP cyclohydrolase II
MLSRFRFFAFILITSSLFIRADSSLMAIYPSIIEKLLLFKDNKFKVFYGGPIDRKEIGIKWMLPVIFEDDQRKTRAAYEVSFINCSLTDADQAAVIFMETSDIDIKFKNCLNDDFALFNKIINGQYSEQKYVLVRFADVAQVFYPENFIYSWYGQRLESDKIDIVKFLSSHFKTQSNYISIHEGAFDDEQIEENEEQIIYKPRVVATKFDGIIYGFNIQKRICKNDIWKTYYLIWNRDTPVATLQSSDSILLRLDSGCVSGQIYDDESCDCLDQLHDALKKIALDSDHQGLIIHIPAHDGRGFGTVPKAETEIYKRGGHGRVNSTASLDTISAAKLLYGENNNYDLRSYDGAACILKSMQINQVILLTDNYLKVSTLQDHGIAVVRQKTETHKKSCLDHIKAKHNTDTYFSE